MDRPIQVISTDELVAAMDQGDPIRLVMALNEWAYRAKHIPGSEHFNTDEELRSSISPDENVIVYCTNPDCHASIALYHHLVDSGYQMVRRYAAGMEGWAEAGFSFDGDWT